MTSAIAGPRIACNLLDSLADDIGNPLVHIIDGSSLSLQEKAQMKKAVEDHLVQIFMGKKVSDLRDYIHEQARSEQ